MTEEIHQNIVNDDVRQWVLPEFSATREEDKMVAGAILMASMKKYLNYRFRFVCGIPTVTLDGNLADWEDIRTRIEKLEEYDLKDWADMLKPILDQFAKKGNVDIDFWSRICFHTGNMSGPRYLNGWITAFCYFDKEGKKQGTPENEWLKIETTQIPPAVVQVDAIVETERKVFKTVLFAGHMGQEVNSDALQPAIGWAIALRVDQ